MANRPFPPATMLENLSPTYVPDRTFWLWVSETFLADSSPAYNEDHAHLIDAHIGLIWTTETNASKGRQVLGMAEEPVFRCGRWQKGRQELQMVEWFGAVPDFVITLDATFCASCSDTEFMALVEHELYHCAQAKDAFGQPKFNKDTGLPSFTLRGHDVEEFVGVVRRYGAGAPDGQLAQLVAAAQATPLLDGVTIALCCGNCNA